MNYNLRILISFFRQITDFVNSIQGVLLFMILVLFRRRVLRLLASKNIICCQLPTSWNTLHDGEGNDTVDEEESHLEMKSRTNVINRDVV